MDPTTYDALCDVLYRLNPNLTPPLKPYKALRFELKRKLTKKELKTLEALALQQDKASLCRASGIDETRYEKMLIRIKTKLARPSLQEALKQHDT